MVDYTLQRKNMVESQVRPSDIVDRRIIRAMLEVPREAFVPAEFTKIAYADTSLPLRPEAGRHSGRLLLDARTLAKMMQALDLGERNLVLEIGTGTGYAAAVLSKIALTTVALESDAALAARAQEALGTLGIDNVVVVTGQLTAGYAQEGPYDAILVHGAVAALPVEILDQLKDGGRLAVIERRPKGAGKAVLWRRLGGTFDRREVFDASAPLLPGFEPKPVFTL